MKSHQVNVYVFSFRNQWPIQTPVTYRRILLTIKELEGYLKERQKSRLYISSGATAYMDQHLWNNKRMLSLVDDSGDSKGEPFALGSHAFGRIWAFLSSYRSFFCQPCYLTGFTASERANELAKLEVWAKAFGHRVMALMDNLKHHRDHVDPPPFRELPAAYRQCLKNLPVRFLLSSRCLRDV